MKKSFKFGLASLAILPLLTPIQEEVMAASSQSAKFKIPTILNSSNKAKRAEFEKLFKQYGIKNLCFTTDDLTDR